ncbi:MAG: PTS system mannose/fructose/sorbose family transporter subunit IID [Gemmatimonadales bacterium]
MIGRLARAWLRLLTVQASFNYDRMQGVGVAYASEPLLENLPGGTTGERYAAAMRHATRYFNAHPYLTGLAVGAVARAEHDGLSDAAIAGLQRALVSPLGSLGDRLIWAGLLPAAVGLALVLAAATSPLVGVLVFLVVYNAVHVAVRGWALAIGWRDSTKVARAINSPGVRASLRVAGPLAGLALGLALPLTAEWSAYDLTGRSQLAVAVVAAVAVVLGRWLWPSLGGLRFGLLLVALTLIGGAGGGL